MAGSAHSFPLHFKGKSKKVEIEKYCFCNEVMGTKVVALELFINFGHKAKSCKMHGRGAREAFLTVCRNFLKDRLRVKKSKLKSIASATK